MSQQIIIGMGEALWDVFPEGKRLGGAPANFAYNISQLGLNGQVVSAIGNDKLGQEILAVFNSKNIKYSLPLVDRPTGTVQVSLDDKGVPCYEICQDVAWDEIPFTEELQVMAQHTQVICFGSLAQRSATSRATINAFIDAMPKDEEVLRIFDINLRQDFYNKEILENSFNKCNILKTNDEELEIIANLFGYNELGVSEVCKALIANYNFKYLILTCGVAGSYIFSKEEESFWETPLVQVKDTVGAGDSFTAAFTVAHLKGMSIQKAHQFAVNVSAYVCTQSGAMVNFPEELIKQVL